jgi:hypothetical protein
MASDINAPPKPMMAAKANRLPKSKPLAFK